MRKFINLKNKETEEPAENKVEEIKEEEKVSFFAKHKKGLIIGTIMGLLAGGTALALRKKGDDSDYDEEFEDDDFEDDDGSEETTDNE